MGGRPIIGAERTRGTPGGQRRGPPRRIEAAHRRGCRYKGRHTTRNVYNVDADACRLAHTCRLEGGHWGAHPANGHATEEKKHILRTQWDGQ